VRMNVPVQLPRVVVYLALPRALSRLSRLSPPGRGGGVLGAARSISIPPLRKSKCVHRGRCPGRRSRRRPLYSARPSLSVLTPECPSKQGLGGVSYPRALVRSTRRGGVIPPISHGVAEGSKARDDQPTWRGSEEEEPDEEPAAPSVPAPPSAWWSATSSMRLTRRFSAIL